MIMEIIALIILILWGIPLYHILTNKCDNETRTVDGWCGIIGFIIFIVGLIMWN